MYLETFHDSFDRISGTVNSNKIYNMYSCQWNIIDFISYNYDAEWSYLTL